MTINSEDVKKKAFELGFHKVGIARAAETKAENKKLKQWLDEKKHAGMAWVEKRKSERGNIFNYFSKARPVTPLGMNNYVGKDN